MRKLAQDLLIGGSLVIGGLVVSSVLVSTISLETRWICLVIGAVCLVPAMMFAQFADTRSCSGSRLTMYLLTVGIFCGLSAIVEVVGVLAAFVDRFSDQWITDLVLLLVAYFIAESCAQYRRRSIGHKPHDDPDLDANK